MDLIKIAFYGSRATAEKVRSLIGGPEQGFEIRSEESFVVKDDCEVWLFEAASFHEHSDTVSQQLHSGNFVVNIVVWDEQGLFTEKELPLVDLLIGPEYNKAELSGALINLVEIRRLLCKSCHARHKRTGDLFGAVFENAGVAILVSDVRTNILLANRKMAQLTGYTVEELVGNSWQKFILPSSLPTMLEYHHLRRKAPELAPKSYESVIVCKDGDTRNVLLDVSLISDSMNSVISITDVTPIHQIKHKLKESEQQYRQLFHDSYSVMLLIDPETGKILEANNAACQFYGYSKDELLRMHIFNINTLTVEEIKNEMTRAREQSRNYFLFRHRLKDGRVIPVEVYSGPIRHNGKDALYSIVHDVSSRLRAEDALRESESRYRYLFDFIPLSMWVYDLDTLAFLDVNEAAISNYGYSREEFLRMTLKDIRPAEDVPLLLDDVQHTTRSLNNAGIWRHKTKSGDIIFVEIISHKIIFSNKEARLVVANNVTDRVKAEQIVKTLGKAIEQSPLSIIITDNDGNIEFVNRRFEEHMQYELKELIGRKPRILNLGHMPEEDYLQMWEALQKHQTWIGEFKNRKKDGSVVLEQVTISPLTDESGQLSNYVLILEDITQKRHNELMIQLLSRSVEQSPNAVIITNPDGTIEYINPSFTSLSGYQPHEAIGANPRILKSGYHPATFYTHLWNVIISGEIWKGEILNKHKDGHDYWVSAVISPILDKRGNITHFIGVQEDITEKKRLHQSLIRAKEKAEESDRLKTAFIHNISHEVRTPMNAIIGFSSLLSDDSFDTEEKTEFISNIQGSAHELLGIITDIIAISSLETGQEKAYPSIFDITEMASELALRWQQRAEAAKLQFIKNLPPPGHFINADRDKLQQILNHLLSNAVKFTPSGAVGLSIEQKGDSWHFSVSDTGIGIPPELHKKVFERFFKIEGGNVEVYRGMGLGLSLCKAYADLLGITINLHSEPGKGSVFSFDIAAQGQGSAGSAISDINLVLASEEEKKASKPLILLAEDEEYNYELLHHVLRRNGYELHWVRNGQDAIDFCRDKPELALVLMDLRMPVVDGVEATRRIKQMRPELPVIAYTAYSGEAEHKMALDAGCSDLLAKPVRLSLVIDTIGRYVTK